MEFINAVIGDVEMYVPVNDKLGACIVLAHKRLNYRRYIAQKRKDYQGKIEKERISMDSDFFYALEDVLEEIGYENVIHHQFERCTTEAKKILYDLFRDDKSIRYLIAVCGYEEEQVLKTIREFFELLKKNIF